jgi:hypothetical protein
MWSNAEGGSGVFAAKRRYLLEYSKGTLKRTAGMYTQQQGRKMRKTGGGP